MHYKIHCFCGAKDVIDMITCQYCTIKVHRGCYSAKLPFVCNDCKRRAKFVNNESYCKLCNKTATGQRNLPWISCDSCGKWYHRACVTQYADDTVISREMKFICVDCYCYCCKYTSNILVKCKKCTTVQHRTCIKGEIFEYGEFICMKCQNVKEFGTPTFQYHFKYAERYERLRRVELKQPRYVFYLFLNLPISTQGI